MPIEEALVTSCGTRFRAIILTSVTTFVGLIPLMSNMTPATMPFVPMAISLAYGVLFATFITLFYVPVLYRIVEDLFGWDRSPKACRKSANPPHRPYAEAGHLGARASRPSIGIRRSTRSTRGLWAQGAGLNPSLSACRDHE